MLLVADARRRRRVRHDQFWAREREHHSRRITIPEGTWPDQPRARNSYRAVVPLIPIHLRPKRGLQNYHVLWEAEWRPAPPVDPLLLRRIGVSDLWVVSPPGSSPRSSARRWRRRSVHRHPMMHRAAPGFNWTQVNWGGPDEPRTEHCSYCGDAHPRSRSADPVEREGWCAEFCDHCQATWWGMETLRQGQPRPEPEAGENTKPIDKYH